MAWTKSRIACFAGPSLHAGRGSACALADRDEETTTTVVAAPSNIDRRLIFRLSMVPPGRPLPIITTYHHHDRHRHQHLPLQAPAPEAEGGRAGGAGHRHSKDAEAGAGTGA